MFGGETCYVHVKVDRAGHGFKFLGLPQADYNQNGSNCHSY